MRNVKAAIRKLKPARKKKGVAGAMLCKLRFFFTGKAFLVPIILTKKIQKG